MIKTISIIGILSLLVTFNSYANDSDRITKLEKEIQELKARIVKLESLLSKPNGDQEIVISGEGWKSITNWRKLTTGMRPNDVEKILGSPHKIDGGVLATWFYKNDGRVTFISEKLESWTEPEQ